MGALGTISFQSNDMTDVFYVTTVEEAGREPSDEALLKIEETDFDADKAWVTGKVPKLKTIHVEGDTASIQGWFKAEDITVAHEISVYLECELAEEFLTVIDPEETERKRIEAIPKDVIL